jgi:hypothetical protein
VVQCCSGGVGVLFFELEKDGERYRLGHYQEDFFIQEKP